MQDEKELGQNGKKNGKKLDASKMSAAEILEAVGVAEPLTESLVHASKAKQKTSEIIEPPVQESPKEDAGGDIQKRIAEIQRQKQEKLRQAQEKLTTEQQGSREMPISQSPVQQEATSVVEKNAKKVRVKAVVISEPAPEEESQKTEVSEMIQEPDEPEEPETPVIIPPVSKEKTEKSGKTKSKKKKKSNNTSKICAILGIAGAGVLILIYFIGALCYQNKFLPHTYANSVLIAGMTKDEAQTALLEQKKVEDVTLVTPKGEKVVFSAQDFKAEYKVPAGSLNDATSESNFNWVGKLFTSTEYAIKYEYCYSEEDLKKLIENYNWGNETSQNAKIIRSDSGKFEIQPETVGDKFNASTLMTYIAKELEAGKSEIVMQDSGCYESYKAKITTEDLQDDLEVYNRFANCNITYDFDDRKITLDSDTIISWLLKKSDGSFVTTSGHDIPLDEEKVTEFVDNMAQETDTFGKDHEFYATIDGWITVPWTKASCYGWQIDRNETVVQLMELIGKGEAVTVEPVYTAWGKGYTRKTDDIGTTYIEVDISAQHMWYYKDNEVIMDYDFVSGTETDPSRRTPRGICQIVGHLNGKTLGTYAVQGYETWVDYWMPFNYLGCGFHDLSRGAYGGSIYMYNGSHGCLNMRHSEAANLYSEIFDGLPVIVHD
ncbi:MAG: L,D-transpeptidase/peptidoglycan binding protein [Oscillospiraceae bacterium]|nr:L,D-transpeptidase/peptidoglycan binding protein [Oscillospiraceae bacterium]